MTDDATYVDLLNRRDYLALEAIASEHLAKSPDVLSAMMLAHSRIRRGLFREGIEALYRIEDLDPERHGLVHDLAAMCTREDEQVERESDSGGRREVASELRAAARSRPTFDARRAPRR